jgi:hypothetical protein
LIDFLLIIRLRYEVTEIQKIYFLGSEKNYMSEKINDPVWISTKQAAAIIGASTSSAQKAIKQLNAKMAAKGYFTIAGYVNKAAFLRFVGVGAEDGNKFEL